MSTLEEKAKEYLKVHMIYEDDTIYDSADRMVGTYSQIMTDFCKKQISQQAKEALERAAEKVTMTVHNHKGELKSTGQLKYSAFAGDHIEINKESILSLIKEY